MLAHVHGQILNWSDLGRSMGVSNHTVQRYADSLAGALVVQLLQPWHENISKRQVKAPRLYIRDSGLLHALLDIGSLNQLDVSPRVGASWEGFVIAQILAHLAPPPEQCFFWATPQGAELDLLVLGGNRRRGFEVKSTAAPSVTPSMRSALASLHLDSLDVIHAGKDTFPLAQRVRAVALARLRDDLPGPQR